MLTAVWLRLEWQSSSESGRSYIPKSMAGQVDWLLGAQRHRLLVMDCLFFSPSVFLVAAARKLSRSSGHIVTRLELAFHEAFDRFSPLNLGNPSMS